MGLAGQNQVRQFYPALDAPGHTTVALVKAGTVGDIAILSADGSDVAAITDFKFFKLNYAGNIVSSDLVKPGNVTSAKALSYVAPTLGTVTMDMTGSGIVVGELVTCEIVIKGFGSYSPEDEYVKKAFYKTVSGNTEEDVVNGLITALNRNFSREVGATATENPYFSFTKTGAGGSDSNLVITEKDQSQFYVVGKKERANIDFTADIKCMILPAITSVASTPGVGAGKIVASMEWYLKGERNDFYRDAGYPHNLENTYETKINETYDLIEISYFDEGRDEAKKSKKQITLAFPVSARANTNFLVDDLETATGITIAALA